MQRVSYIDQALGFWTKVAIDNGGWTVRSLTIWVSEDGSEVVDSVATREGDGSVYVYHGNADEPQVFPQYLGES